MTVLLIEQNAYRALEIAGRADVLETVEMALDGPVARLIDAPRICAAYLGD